MEKTELEAILYRGEYGMLIELLEREMEIEYDEFSMLKLCQVYFMTGEDKKAKKIMKRLKMLFPSGDYLEEEEKLLATMRGEPAALPGLNSLLQQTQGKKKRQTRIPMNIQECFENVVGIKSVQIELDKFYKLLRFQNERKQSDFQADLLKTTHFAVTGARGCGKTLVGEIIGRLLCDFGVRAEQEVVKIEARDIKAAYEADKTNGIDNMFVVLLDATVIVENIQDFMGDCADPNPVEKPILLALKTVMKMRKDDLSVVFTGAKSAVERMLLLEDSFRDILCAVVDIPPYSAAELFEIAQKLAEGRTLRIHESAKATLLKKIDMECRGSDFMNAVTLGRYLDKAAGKLAERYYEDGSTTDAAMVYLMPEDFDTEPEDEGLKEYLDQLDALTGLRTVKLQVRKQIESLVTEQLANQAGAARKGGHGTLHMVFEGNPGTGKTTVARLMGKIYHHLGVLPNGKMVECTRSDLIGKYQGHTAKLVQEKVKEAAGGVLFIDEAYALCRGDGDSFGHEAVDELISAIENYRDSFMVILAGYTEEMKQFLKSNPGFGSRIRHYLQFADYSTAEMISIFKQMVKDKNMYLDGDTEQTLFRLIDARSRIPDFGNARGVRNLVEDVLMAMDERLTMLAARGGTIPSNQYDIILNADLQAVLGKEIADDKTLDQLMEELNNLTGLNGVKAKVREMVDDIQVQEYIKNCGTEQKVGHGTLHLVFKGNAGTGKTTVARLIGQIYKKLGLLSKNVFIETGRKDLVAGYQGQTAPRVIAKVKEAEGGILFIDEAYTLVSGEDDSFGLEAVNTLVAELENRRENLMVIVAGYEEEMDKFLVANQGLTSRLSNEIVFEDYNEEELKAIFYHIAKEKGMLLEDGLEKEIESLIRKAQADTRDFGNARGIRNLVERIEKKKNTRIAAAIRDGHRPSQKEVSAILKEDVTVPQDIVQGDVHKAMVGHKVVNDKTLDELINELNSLTGLSSVKTKVCEMVDDILVQEYLKNNGVEQKRGHSTLHLVFKGNAGTGKTTVARLIGQIYKKLGLLSKNVFVETGRKDLVAGYMGQTAALVTAKVKAAEGGILFIDEAYTLVNGESDTFGLEAVNTLVAELENRRENLMVIVAGYAEEMDRFLAANQGLTSRLSNEIIFEDYSEEELKSIFCYMAQEKGLLLEEGLDKEIRCLIRQEKTTVVDFGNARGVRNIMERVERKKNSRIAAAIREGRQPQKEEAMTLKKEDME